MSEREAFEAWARPLQYDLRTKPDGSYVDLDVHDAFAAFRAGCPHFRDVNAALVAVIERAQIWMPEHLDDWHASARAALAAAEPRDEGGRG